MQYLFEIARIKVLCDIPFPIQIQTESADFFHPVSVECLSDQKFIFRPSKILPVMALKGHWEINRYYIDTFKEQQIYHCPTRYLPPYACVTWPEMPEKNFYCDYIQGMESYMNYSHNICDLMGLETLLLKYEGLLLHASFIRWQNRGILFSAPSGTGKSTQADLWKKYENAETLNGDRAGIRYVDGEWTAFGLPLAGSSRIYRNESASVNAIVVLRQSPENHIRRLKPTEAFGCLYPEITVHRWCRAWVEKTSSLLLDLVTQVPIWLLECRPDVGAVQLVKESILTIQE